jgi:hypothetical protein
MVELPTADAAAMKPAKARATSEPFIEILLFLSVTGAARTGLSAFLRQFATQNAPLPAKARARRGEGLLPSVSCQSPDASAPPDELPELLPEELPELLPDELPELLLEPPSPPHVAVSPAVHLEVPLEQAIEKVDAEPPVASAPSQ